MPRARLTDSEMIRTIDARSAAADAYGLDTLPIEDIGATGGVLVEATTPAAAQAAIDLTPGVDVQEFSSILDLLAALALAGNALKIVRVNAGENAFELAAAGGGGGLADGDYGDIAVTGAGTVLTIDPGTVTLAKQANMATASLVYRKTAGAGAPEVQALATLKTDLGLTGINSGDQSLAAYATTAAVAAGYQPLDADLTAIAALATSAYGRAFLALADGAALTALGNAFTSGLNGLAPASGGGSSNFLRADGTWAAPGAGGINGGVTVIDFGAFPGASDASVTVTGQAAIVAGSRVRAFLMATATADHSADEHWLEPIEVMAGNIVAATGFTIYAVNSDRNSGAPAHTRAQDFGGGDTRIYGQFTVGWEWI